MDERKQAQRENKQNWDHNKQYNSYKNSYKNINYKFL